MALVALPIDQGLNVLYRQTGMSATAANALSGATSTAVVGVGGIGDSVAMGELALGPEMIPAALLTLLFTGIAAGLGAASGSEEDKARKKATDTVEAQYRLIQALRANEFDAVARASLSSSDQQLITDDLFSAQRARRQDTHRRKDRSSAAVGETSRSGPSTSVRQTQPLWYETIGSLLLSD